MKSKSKKNFKVGREVTKNTKDTTTFMRKDSQFCFNKCLIALSDEAG